MQSERLCFQFDEVEKERLKKHYIDVYRRALGEIYGTDLSGTGIDFAMIEQAVTARNRGQHGTTLTSFHEAHDKRTLAKHPRPHFADEREINAWIESGRPRNIFLTPALAVRREALFAAIDEVERLAVWMEANMDRVERWRAAERQRQADQADRHEPAGLKRVDRGKK